METVKDFFGREIKVGQLITYPTRSGSCVWQNWAIVKEIGTFEEYGRTKQKLTCRKVENKFSRIYDTESGDWKKGAKYLESRYKLVHKLVAIFRTTRAVILTENIEEATSKNIISPEIAEIIKSHEK